LTIFEESDTIQCNSDEAEKYAEQFLQREPLVGEKGRGCAAEYTAELTPERL